MCEMSSHSFIVTHGHGKHGKVASHGRTHLPLQVIPNNDEKCTWGWSFDDALRAMVFTLAAVCTILLCIGCIR